MIEKRGAVWSFSADESTADKNLLLNHTGPVDDGPNEAGLLGFAFHPEFQSNNRVFLSYTTRSNGNLVSVVTEMNVGNNGTLNANTEKTILSVAQPFGNHNGGHIAFGPDGFLYIGFGDGGSANDPQGNGQKMTTRLGKMLRVDVDGASPFQVPSDNPFVGAAGLDEIYALGLRNPWRFSFDTESGELWLADVGQNEFEEIDLIENGGNYGWARKEGTACFNDPAPCSAGLIDPVFAYKQTQTDRSVTGGYVYRGSDIPGFEGSYIYGDFVSGNVWALTADGNGGFDNQPLFNSGLNVASFAQDAAGEVYFFGFGSGTQIRKIIADEFEASNFPDVLSDTGCFDQNDPKVPVSGLIPYSVNAPLWSDGAAKERHLAIPDGTSISVGANGDWTFPIGSVLTKTFSIGGKRVETRLMVRHDDGGWAGYTYQWNQNDTEAFLLAESKNVVVSGQAWTIPGRADCMACHTQAAGFSLGPETGQLNGDGVYPSTNRIANQVKTLVQVGVLNSPGLESSWQRFASPTDETESVASRARAYLHSNCSNCHRPGGPGRGAADLRHHLSFAQTKLCNEPLDSGELGIPGAKALVPGDPSKSMLSLRMSTVGPRRMPPLGSKIVDDEGTDAIDSWIDSISFCP